MATIEEWSTANKAYEYQPEELKPGIRYWIIYKYGTEPHNDIPSFTGTFLRLDVDPFNPQLPVAVFDHWADWDPLDENHARLDSFRFFSTIPLWKAMVFTKRRQMRSPRTNVEYTPGTDGLSIQEELMQRTWHPSKLQKLLNQGYSLNAVSNEFAPYVEGVGTKRGGGCGCSIWKGGYKPTRKNRNALARWKRGESIGFTMRSSLKAKGLIPRTSKKNRGKYIVSKKYSRRR
jgi:hypothetical protein